MSDQAYLMDYFALETLLAKEGVSGVLRRYDQALALLTDVSELADREMLRLLRKAFLLNASFLNEHPEALFQCLWNQCWWHDCPALADFVEPPEGGWPEAGPLWEQPGPKLYHLLERWRAVRAQVAAGVPWVRSLRPPTRALASPLLASWVLPDGDTLHPHSFGVSTDEVVLCSRQYEPIPRDHPHYIKDRRQPFVRRKSVWEVSQYQLVDLSEDERFDPRCSPDGRWLLHWDSWQEPFVLYDRKSHAIVHTFDVIEDYSVTNAFFSADGRFVIAYGWYDDYDGLTYLWAFDESSETPTLSLLHQVSTYPEPGAVAVGASGERLYLGCGTELIIVDVATGHKGQQRLPSAIGALVISEDESLVAFGDGSKVLLWSLDESPSGELRHEKDSIGDVMFSPDGRSLYARPWLWEGESGLPVKRLADSVGGYLEGGPPDHSRFLGDGVLVAVERGISTWDPHTGELLLNWGEFSDEGSRHPIWFSHRDVVAYSPDGSVVACSFGWREHTRLFFLSSQESRTIPELGKVAALSFSHDGRWLVVGYTGGGIGLYDWANDSWGPSHSLHETELTALFCSPFHDVAVSAAKGSPILFWSLETGEVLKEIPLSEELPSIAKYWSEEKQAYIELAWSPSWRDVGWLMSFPEWCPTPPEWKVRTTKRNQIEFQSTSAPEVWALYPTTEGAKLQAHPSAPIWAGRSFHIQIECDGLEEDEEEAHCT